MKETIDVNAMGAKRIAQVFAGHMSSASRHGQLAAITGEMGSIDRIVSTEMMGYRLSKAALNKARRCLSIELGRIAVISVVIHPGWVATDKGGEDAPAEPGSSAASIRTFNKHLRRRNNGTCRTWHGGTLPW